MLVELMRYLRGYLRIRVTGYSPERFLNLCSNKHIYLWGLKPQNNSYEMYIGINSFRKLKPILKKTGTKVSIIERFGLPFFLHKYRKRKVFFLGSATCVLLIYMLSLFIWNIHIEGNRTITDEMLLEYLDTTNVNHGMTKWSIDCDRIAKDIRKQFNDIIWVSVSVKGTRLMIEVRENSDTIEDVTSEEGARDIIATKDGTIIQMVTRKGVPQVRQGDAVKKGDLLVSGSVEVKDDSGEVKNYQYQTSDADILAETTIKYEEEIPFTYDKKEYTNSKRNSFYLQFGNWRFSFGLQKNSYEMSEIYTTTNQMKIGENFYLPIVYGTKSIREYKLKAKKYSKEELQELLSEHFYTYCKELEAQGIKILENHVKIYLSETKATAKGTIKVIEDIGKHKSINIDFQQPPVIE